jgi:hypothetical protein
MINFKKILLTLAWLTTTLNLFAQQDDLYLKPRNQDLSRIAAPLDSFNRRLPVEKVYLHLDKPYYNIGDTLWFKSYLLDGVNLTPSGLSKLLYIELANDSAEIVRRICIPIKNGVGWGQIPLPKIIFREGGYTLRAYTNWMQNFDDDYVFSQQFYIGIPSEKTWLIKSAASLKQVEDKNQLQVSLKLTHPDNLLSPVALKKVEVKIYDEWHYIYNETMQTGLDGTLNFSHILKDKAEVDKVRVQITSLEKGDNYKVMQVPLSLSRDQNIDLQFLPEGGNLVSGLKSTVGFKAIGEDGKSRAVLGAVYDGSGKEVISFASIHNGMGSFEFTPKPGETYTAKMLKPVIKVFAFPKTSPGGTVMHLTNTEQDGTLRINIVGVNTMIGDTVCYLVGKSRGVLYYSQKVDLNRAELNIDKKLFPAGIARFTLFKGKTPLNERAVFINNHDELIIHITPNKTAYNKRDSVGLNIEVKDRSGFPVQGSFSMAVTDDSQIRADSTGNYSINTSLLLNAELKGNIEDPGYYINRKDKQSWLALDNLLLTQAWTGYDWKDIFAPAKLPQFKVEKELVVTGQVTNLNKKPVVNTQVLISSQKPSFIATTLTDTGGIYQFRKLPDIDSGSFFIQASNAKGKRLAMGEVTVDKFRPIPLPDNATDQVFPWYVNTDRAQVNYIQHQLQKAHGDDYKLTGRVLKEVKIKDKKILKDPILSDDADLVFDEQDIKKSAVITLYEFLKQKLPGIKVIDIHRMPTLMWHNTFIDVFVDGTMKHTRLPVKMNMNPTCDELIEQLNLFNIATFKSMEITFGHENYGASLKMANESELNFLSIPRGFYLRDRALVLSAKGEGTTSIYVRTTSGTGWQSNRVPYAVTYRPLPIMHPQQFYRPKYDVKPAAIDADYRATLHWEPNINTDANGRARVSFYTSDIAGKYTITVSGVDATGGIGDSQIKINK